MVDTRFGRLSVLAAELGIGAVIAAVPWSASADPFSPFDPNDFDISINGIDLFHVGTATATSGLGDIAIADGANSTAFAAGGFGDFASADGAGSIAGAGSDAGGATGNNFDSASAVGPLSEALAGLNGSNDFTSSVGDQVSSFAGFGTAATPANFDFANVWGNLTAPTSITTFAEAIHGGNDLAFVVDPFASQGSDALAGLPGNFDVADAFVDNVVAAATGGDFIFHIVPFF